MRNVSLAPFHKKHAAKIPNLLIAVNAGGPIARRSFGNLGVGMGRVKVLRRPWACCRPSSMVSTPGKLN